MTLLWKRVTQLLSLSVIALCLIVPLVACSFLGGTTSAPKQTSSTPPPTLAGTTYTGEGYTISYPKDWTKSGPSTQTIFQDSLGANALSVVVTANPNGVVSPDTVLDTVLASAVKGAGMTNTSPANVPASVSLAGETWMQKGTTGTASKGGTSAPFEIVVLSTNHPANGSDTKLFTLIYAGPLLGSNLMDEQTFQSMLASFKFTS